MSSLEEAIAGDRKELQKLGMKQGSNLAKFLPPVTGITCLEEKFLNTVRQA